MDKERPETNYVKSRAGVGAALLAGSIFTGFAAPIVALFGGAFLIGSGLRYVFNDKARKEYKSEREASKKEREEKAKKSATETKIYNESRLVKEVSDSEVYQGALETAATVTYNYLSNLPEKKLSGLDRFRIYFQRSGLARLLFGQDTGYKLRLETN